MRAWLIAGIALLLAGCATSTENTLSAQRRAALKIESVNVTVAPDAAIIWADAESEFDRSKNAPATGAYLTPGPSSGEKRTFVAQKAAARIKASFQNRVVGAFHGTEPARVEVVVHHLHIPSHFARVLVGGDHVIKADITVVNAKTGATIIRAPDFSGQAQGGGTVSLIVDPFLPDAVDRLANTLANSFRNWLQTGSQMAAGQL